MDSPKTFESPLATMEKRNKLARKPLYETGGSLRLAALRNREKNPEPVKSSPQSGKKPKFTTSSPRQPAADNDNTPGVSIIETGGKKSISRRGQGESNTTKSFTLDEADPEENNKSDDDDDDQPSGRVTRRPMRSTGTSMTPARIKKRKEVDKPATTYCSSLMGVMFGIALVAFTALPLVYELMGATSNVEDTDWLKVKKNVISELSALQTQFPSQEKCTWAILRSSLKEIMTSDPKQPSVLLLVSNQAGEKVTQCLGYRLSSLISETFNATQSVITRNGRDFQSKSSFFEALQSDLGATSSFLLFNLEQLQGDSALALHAFTDSENAPYKQSAIVLTMTSQLEGKSETAVDNRVEIELERVWKSLGEDKLYSLISRITISVVDMKHEEKLSDVC